MYFIVPAPAGTQVLVGSISGEEGEERKDVFVGYIKCICILAVFQLINYKKGPAVWGLRAQIDRSLYKKHMLAEIRSTPNLDIMAAAVDDLEIDNQSIDNVKSVKGVRLVDGRVVESRNVVITTGTFLRGLIFMGLESWPAGRMGEDASYGLSKTFEDVGFRISRLRTGTPPRLKSSTIDFSRCVRVDPDRDPYPFSFVNDKVWIDAEDQLPCHITTTPLSIESIIKDNLHLSRYIQTGVVGPRYCPSILAKVTRFPGGFVFCLFYI